MITVLPRHDSARLATESEASARALAKEQKQIEEKALRREEEAAVAAAAAAKAETEAIERCVASWSCFAQMCAGACVYRCARAAFKRVRAGACFDCGAGAHF